MAILVTAMRCGAEQQSPATPHLLSRRGLFGDVPRWKIMANGKGRSGQHVGIEKRLSRGHTMSESSSKTVDVFIVYAHEDLDYRQEICGLLESIGSSVNVWSDGEILPGEEWEQAIKEKLTSADLIVMLISRHFLRSKYIREVELPTAYARHNAGEARVVPILIRDCDWRPKKLAGLQLLPRDAQPVHQWPDDEEDKRYRELSEDLRKAIDWIAARSVAPPQPSQPDRVPTKPAEKQDADEPLAYLHSFCGLIPGKPVEAGNEEPFQSLVFSMSPQNNPISFLWADARGENRIEAHFVDGEPGVLKIAFRNAEQTWPCNLCLHPQNLTARALGSQQKLLTFEVTQVLPAEAADDPAPVVVAIRIVDGFLQHWAYIPFGQMYEQFAVPPNDWGLVEIEMQAPTKWKLFESDGNPMGPKRPDFRVLSQLILIVGRGRDTDLPAHGEGVIKIRNIRFRSE